MGNEPKSVSGHVTFCGSLDQRPVFNLDHVFAYHPPTPEQVEKYKRIRDAAKVFAQVILDETKGQYGSDQEAAIRHVRNAVMTANAAIALDGHLYVMR